MKRLPLIAAAALALTASIPAMSMMASPATAQEWRDDDEGMSDGDARDLVRDALSERVQSRQDLRDLLMDRLRSRQDLRDLLLDRIRTRQDMRDFLMEHLRDEDEGGGGGWRDRLREHIRAMRESDGGDYGRWHGRLMQRIAERRGEDNCAFLTRSLRKADGSLLVIVRRRVCRD